MSDSEPGIKSIRPDGGGTPHLPLGSYEDDAARQAERERVSARVRQITPVLNRFFPSQTSEEVIEALAKKNKTTVEELGADDKREAKLSTERARLKKKFLADKIARTTIPDEQIEQYIGCLVNLTRQLTPQDQALDGLGGFFERIQSVEKAKFYAGLAKQWNERFLQGLDSDTFVVNAREFSELVVTFEPNEYSDSERKSDEDIKATFDAYCDFYATWISIPTEVKRNEEVGGYPAFVRRAATDFPEGQVKMMDQIMQEALRHSATDMPAAGKFLDAVGRYGQHHQLPQDADKGLLGKLLPAIERNDPGVGVLIRGGNIWGMKKRDFGAADFLCHSYALPISPPSINELLMITREFATSDLARFRQNRLDALTLRHPFGILRDFIHDQRPYVHEVIGAMLEYYDTGNSAPLLAVVDKTDYLKEKSHHQALLALDLYNDEVEEEDGTPTPTKLVRPIDVLRRLYENTKPVQDAPPATSDANFDVLLKQLAEGSDVGHAFLKQAVDYANDKLIDMIQRGEVGIDPNFVLALSWIGRKGFEALQKLTYEGQMEAYAQPWFHSILRLQELTWSSTGYDGDEFQEFLKNVSNAKNPQEAYRLISQRGIGHISSLAARYKEIGKDERTGALWSGNIAHELTGLTDPRPATTEYGRRHRDEAQKPEHKRLSGD